MNTSQTLARIRGISSSATRWTNDAVKRSIALIAGRARLRKIYFFPGQ